MSSRYLNMVRGQQRGGFQLTSRTVLAVIAVVAMCCSAIYWWGVQSELTNNFAMAFAFTAILVLAPPVLVSFLIPWSPGGMLLQKINARTWGYIVVIVCALFLIYYSFEIQYTWWAAQPVVANTELILQQVLVGIIGFIIIPALLWTPVTSEELVEQVRQAHLVKRYELQAQADIAILRNTMLRAQEKALIGFANLTPAESEELAGVMRGLVTSIDRTLQDVGESVKKVSNATIPFDSLSDNDDIRDYLDYIHSSLTNNTLTVDNGSSDVANERPARNDLMPPQSASMLATEHNAAPRRQIAEERYERVPRTGYPDEEELRRHLHREPPRERLPRPPRDEEYQQSAPPQRPTRADTGTDGDRYGSY